MPIVVSLCPLCYMNFLAVIKRNSEPGNHHARLPTLKLLSLWSLWFLLGYAAEDDTVLPAEKNDDITEPYYVFSKDVCVTSPQLRDAALALMSLHSPPQGKKC